MTAVKLKLFGLLLGAGVLVVGMISWVGNPYEPTPIATGAAGKRQPAPTGSDGTYMYVTVSWEQGKTAAVSITAGGAPMAPGMWVSGEGTIAHCDVVCTESPTKFSIQVRRGDRVILSLRATSGWGRVFCSLRRVGERDAQLVKPAKSTGLEGGVVCEQTAR